MRIEVPDECEDWVGWVTERLLAHQASIKIPVILQGEWPEWVCNVAREFIQTLYPAPRFELGSKLSPSTLSAVIGQRLAYFHGMAAASPPELQALSEGHGAGRERELKRSMLFVETAFKDAAAAVCLAMLAPDHHGSEFLTGFAKGFAKKPADLKASNFLRSNTLLYLFLLRGWRSVSKFDKLEDFHAALCRHLGKRIVGKKRRIAKMCQRIGLRFRGPGRPSKKR